MTTWAILPLKARSTRAPGKNLRDLGGRPLWTWMFSTLLATDCLDGILLALDQSLYESHEIHDRVLVEQAARSRRVPTRIEARPARLVEDGSDMNDTLVWADDLVGGNRYVQVHATSPFVRPETLEAARMLSIERDASVLAGVGLRERLWTGPSAFPSPWGHDPAAPPVTQNLAPVWIECCAFFVYTASALRRTGSRVRYNPMIFELSPVEGWDIDEEWQFEVAELLAARTGAPAGGRT